MSGGCVSPIPWATLVDYWAGDLPAPEEDAVEEHLFGCASCTTEAARVAGVTETIRGAIPPVVSRRRVEEMRGRGARVRENAFLPGDRREVVFGADTDLLIHRLSGLDLARAGHVTFRIRVESTGELMTEVEDAPFERSEGVVLVACQRHYASLPADTRMEVDIHAPGEPVRTATYTILHKFL